MNYALKAKFGHQPTIGELKRSNRRYIRKLIEEYGKELFPVHIDGTFDFQCAAMICEHTQQMNVSHIIDNHFFCPCCGITEYVTEPSVNDPDVVYFIDQVDDLAINPAVEEIDYEQDRI